MPNRIIRDGILTSNRIGKLEPLAELFYRRLISVVDDFGRYYAMPQILLAGCYPLLPSWANVALIEDYLDQCSKQGLLVVYEVNEVRFLELTGFKQRIRPGQTSKFPEPAGISGGLREVPARATTTPTPTTTTPAVVVVSEKTTTPEVSQALAVVEPEEYSVLSIFERTEALYCMAGVATADGHKQMIIQHLIGISPPERRERIPRYVTWALGTGKWDKPGKTKGFLALMRDGDWDVDLTPRTLPVAREPTKRESAIQTASRRLREEVCG